MARATSSFPSLALITLMRADFEFHMGPHAYVVDCSAFLARLESLVTHAWCKYGISSPAAFLRGPEHEVRIIGIWSVDT